VIDCGQFTRPELTRAGFVGFESVGTLRTTRCRAVPGGPGVYCLLREADDLPAFLAVTTGGRFKGRDKSLPVEALAARWIAGSNVVYIGKATSLRGRLDLLVGYGRGWPWAHEGGYPLWQLPDSDALLVAWMEAPQHTELENHLLTSFAEGNRGRLPYANTAGPRRP
jgi:hypothetical protein